MSKNIIQYNKSGNKYGYNQLYNFGNTKIIYKGYYVNGVEYGYMECYYNHVKSINVITRRLELRFHLCQ